MVKRANSGSGPQDQVEADIDALFMLPLAEFTPARNTLAAQLKKSGRQDESERVKLFTKPPISAWAVNQLYWEHRDAFDDLIATGKRFRPGPRPNAAGMRDSLDARRDALIHLSDLATQVLTDAGHNPSQETLRRIVTNLEAISAYALLPGGPTPGRLTSDVDPPSFELLASLLSGAAKHEDTQERFAPARKPGSTTPDTPKRAATAGEVRKLEEFRRAKIAAAKTALQDAKRSLTDARAEVQQLEAKQKKASAEVKEAEKHKRSAESLLDKATFAYEAAVERVKGVEAEIKEAEQTVDDVKRMVEESTKTLEALLR